MKRFLTLSLLLVLLSSTSAWAQQEGQQQYLFDEFQNGRVAFKNGITATSRLNYSLISNLFVFIDTDDEDQIKEIANVESIGTITVGSRMFQVSPTGEAIEMVQFQNPIVLACYTGESTDRGQTTAYGGRSQTAAIRSVGSLHSGGRAYNLRGDDRWVVTGIDKEYQVERGGRMRTFSVLNQFLKIYPKQNREAIERFAVDNAVDFNSVEKVVELCNYAESLD
jgi:hypothetical protein